MNANGIATRLRAAPRGELAALGLITAMFAASVVWHPSDDGGYVFCPFRRATGVPCPGCGLTRSFCAVAKGHVERGFDLHWLGPALFLVAFVYWVRGVAVAAGYGEAVARFDDTVGRWRLVRAGAAVLLVAWAIRLATLAYGGGLPALWRGGDLFRLF
jgi:hypothetical protein